VSRQIELTKAPAVITVGIINAGVRSNIMPESCTMMGTIRTLDKEMQKEIHEKIKRTATNIAEASGATAEVKIESKTLVTFNDPGLVKNSLSGLQKAAGTDNVRERDWVTGAEDFSYFGEKVPAFFFNIGGMPRGNDPKKAPPHHTPDFFIDESGMKTGIKAFCNIVFDYLNSQNSASQNKKPM
jgi:amidohydrolase